MMAKFLKKVGMEEIPDEDFINSVNIQFDQGLCKMVCIVL